MKNEIMYRKLAKYYDKIYSWKDYESECKVLHKLIQKYKESDGNELLEIGCGTGNYLKYLNESYNVMGLDINDEMLEVARNKLPGVEFIQSDMADFELGKKFDVILCLFASISYITDQSDLERTIRNFSRHLKQGGILIIEPFFSEDTYRVKSIHANFVDEPDVKIVRMHVSKKKDDIAVLDFHFLIATDGEVEHLVDRHEIKLFDREKFLPILENENLDSKFIENGLENDREGIYISIKK